MDRQIIRRHLAEQFAVRGVTIKAKLCRKVARAMINDRDAALVRRCEGAVKDVVRPRVCKVVADGGVQFFRCRIVKRRSRNVRFVAKVEPDGRHIAESGRGGGRWAGFRRRRTARGGKGHARGQSCGRRNSKTRSHIIDRSERRNNARSRHAVRRSAEAP